MPRVYVRIPLEERFWKKVNKDGPVHPTLGTACWLWTGATNDKGYGLINTGGATGPLVYVHRYSYELHKGPLPAGQWALHRCDVPNCVNPDHFFAGTNNDNVADMVAKGRHRNNPRRGLAHHNAKLTPEKVAEARSRWTNSGKTGRSASGDTLESLAAEYGVSSATMWAALTGKTWSG